MAEGVQLITPGGGGGAQEIAKPVHAPDYVGMYGEAIRGALEPVKFQWDAYAKSQELSNQLQELGIRGRAMDETIRHNRADEVNKDLDIALRRQDHEENIRKNKADELYRTNLLALDQQKENEAERHTNVEENREHVLDTLNNLKEMRENMVAN